MTKGEEEGADRNLWLEKMIYLYVKYLFLVKFKELYQEVHKIKNLKTMIKHFYFFIKDVHYQ